MWIGVSISKAGLFCIHGVAEQEESGVHRCVINMLNVTYELPNK